MSMFYDLDMPPVHLFGGINMSFLGLGALGRRSGAIFIRRTMSGDNVYKAVFKQYIDYLAEKRFPLLWALEGTRSRTGKLMPPRYGLINYVVDSYVRAASTDMILMPISIAYDQVPEVGDYIAEHKGVGKRPESASWFMQYISGLRNPFGRIHVRFGEGVKLSEVLGEPHPDLRVGALDVQKIAFRLAVDANSVTPILGTSLIALVLAAAGGKAMTLSELAEECAAMVRLVHKLRLPVSGDVNLAGMEVLQRMLGQLVHTGVLLRYEGGQEPLFAIAPDAIMAASYYRNAAIHFLVIGAIAELALVEVARRDCVNALGTLHEEALRLRDLLKFEFFFHEKAHFIEELEQHLDIREPSLARQPRRGWARAVHPALVDASTARPRRAAPVCRELPRGGRGAHHASTRRDTRTEDAVAFLHEPRAPARPAAAHRERGIGGQGLPGKRLAGGEGARPARSRHRRAGARAQRASRGTRSDGATDRVCCRAGRESAPGARRRRGRGTDRPLE